MPPWHQPRHRAPHQSGLSWAVGALTTSHSSSCSLSREPGMEPYCGPGQGLPPFSLLLFRLQAHSEKDRGSSLQMGRRGSERAACSPTSHSRFTASAQQADLESSQVFPLRTGSLCSPGFLKAFSRTHGHHLLNIFHRPGWSWAFYLHKSFHLLLTTAL